MAKQTISYVIDASYTIVSFNPAAAEAYPQLVVGKKCHSCLSGLEEPCPACPVAKGIAGPHRYFDPIRKIGETVDAVEMVLPDGSLGHALVISSDDEELLADSEVDQVTGLPNRLGFQHFCAQFLPSRPDAALGILALDIGAYEDIVQQYGRERAEEVLRHVAKHLSAPGAMIAYMGAGRFFGAMELVGPESVDGVANALHTIDENAPVPELGIKAGLYRGNAADGPIMTLLDYAEAALNSIRGVEGRTFNIVNMDEYRSLKEERQALTRILQALDDDEFDIYLQPKCQIESGALVGSEALARWVRPDGTVVSPGAFVPQLEKAGLIGRLDVAVWEKTCQAIRSWIDEGLDPLPVSMNVSRIDVAEMDVASVIAGLADRYGVPHELIEAEITESAYVENEGIVRLAEQRLQENGFRVLIDDFGSGYSSLAMLKDANADILKLDMGFLDFDDDDKSRAADIVYAVLEMAHQLDMYVIVEGVETQRQVRMLEFLGCQYAQGYFFYRPMPRQEFAKLLRGSKAAMIPAGLPINRKSSVQRLAECFWRVAEVNVSTGSYRFIRNVPEPSDVAMPRPATIGEHAERYIALGYIHPDDVDAYRAASNVDTIRADIQRGSHRERKAFRFREEDGWRWYVLETILTEDYSPEEPTVLFTWRVASDDIGRREDAEALVRSMYSQAYRVNLDTLKCERIQGDSLVDQVKLGADSGIFSFIEQAIAAGLIHPDDTATLLGFEDVQRLRRHFGTGGKERSLIFRARSGEGWASHIVQIARSVEYSKEQPIVVVTLRDAKMPITEAERRRSVDDENMRSLFEQSREDCLYEFIFDLTQDKIMAGTNLDAFAARTGIDTSGSIKDVLSDLTRLTMSPEQAERYLKTVHPERLVSLYESGVHYDQLEFQRTLDGEPRWMRIVLHLYSPEGSDDVWGNGIVCDIQDAVDGGKSLGEAMHLE